MPPKTRGSKITKASKENIDVNTKSKQKISNKVAKPNRKALADKTNSASDDNASILPKKVIGDKQSLLSKPRPRRDRRLPNRYEECSVLQKLSNSKSVTNDSENPIIPPNKQNPVVILSSLETPKPNLDSSLIARKSKRICRLPSKFEDHIVSPSRFVSVQPAYASTPKIQDKPAINTETNLKKVLNTSRVISTKVNRKRTGQKRTCTVPKNDSSDTNNNAKTNQLLLNNKPKITETSPKLISNTKTKPRKLANNDYSLKILEDKKNSLKRDASNIDVYEFTYDPNEEPPPPKKKRKKPTKKREPKPKIVTFKSNYDRNLAKALTALKNTVVLNSARFVAKPDNPKDLTTDVNKVGSVTSNAPVQINSETKPINPTDLKESMCNPDKTEALKNNYNSVRVEDIVLDFEQDNCVDDINYSPVNSPSPHNDPAPIATEQNQEIQTHNDDPLNLRGNISFFDDEPVASSSMNVSVRHPAASPWRVEFGNLPIKWQVNTYVKPNMTPAFESSFINFNESKKKHVYTNMGLDTNEANDLPQIYEDNASKLKQTSIISFIKEVVEKSAKKKKEKMTPIKDNSVFEDLNNTNLNDVSIRQKQVTPYKSLEKSTVSLNICSAQNQYVNNSVITDENERPVDNSIENKTGSSKISSKKKNKDVTYFGFDDTDNQDQENESPIKKMDKKRLRALKPRSRAVLQEINAQVGPTRATVPVAIKSKPIQGSETANKLFDQMKSATEPPEFPEKEVIQSTGTVNITEINTNVADNDDDEESVHLFEDVELIHHLKAHRKSYGKAKKTVTFRQNSVSDSDVAASDVGEKSASSDEDDLLDLTFKVPAVEPTKPTKKKKTKKQKLSKKEEKEVEAWAAGFNSMCEDIEEFDLVVE